MEGAHVVTKRKEQRAALHLCSISLTPHSNPVASRDGMVFECAAITQLSSRTGLNPITGRPLSPHQLIPLTFTHDLLTRRYCCPVLRKIFDGTIKVVVIATTGRVYSYAAVQKLNLHPRTMRDLVDNTPFTMNDIIVLYDPEQHVWLASDLNVPHQALSHVTCPPRSANTLPSPPFITRHSLSPNASTPSLPSLSAQGIVPPIEFKSLPPHPASSAHEPVPGTRKPLRALADSTPIPMRLSPPSSLFNTHQHTRVPSTELHPPAVHPVHSQVSQTYHRPLESMRRPDPCAADVTITDMNMEAKPSFRPPEASRGPQNNLKRMARRSTHKSPLAKKPRFGAQPSSAQRAVQQPVDPQISMARFYHRKKEEEERKLVYKKIRKGKKGKGYVRVVTNIGHLNIELHCDRVPTTCDNFLTLSERRYYDGLTWHRVVPGFIAQTGDPTGKGDGGESAWGGYVKDEIRANLSHDAPGIVSMANSGRDTNRSQWFICFDAASHLDGTHTVFGKVVGGLYVLQKMESEAEMGHPLTVERIEVLVNPIRQARVQLEKSKVQSVPGLSITESPRPQCSQGSIVSTIPSSLKQENKPKFMPLKPEPSSSFRSLIDKPNLPQSPRISHLPSIRNLMNAASFSPGGDRRPPTP
eukprot:gb/GEZJ01000667.1/.p1 GENE.gb/GEZJ01000667.1/~~gb/GEZJ01000667.1/.p1  ORF type:complete len:640 (+),score=52.47 gb/GEZJ01000667.1/:3303-5222(+)